MTGLRWGIWVVWGPLSSSEFQFIVYSCDICKFYEYIIFDNTWCRFAGVFICKCCRFIQNMLSFCLRWNILHVIHSLIWQISVSDAAKWTNCCGYKTLYLNLKNHYCNIKVQTRFNVFTCFGYIYPIMPFCQPVSDASKCNILTYAVYVSMTCRIYLTLSLMTLCVNRKRF